MLQMQRLRASTWCLSQLKVAIYKQVKPCYEAVSLLMVYQNLLLLTSITITQLQLQLQLQLLLQIVINYNWITLQLSKTQ